MNTRPSARALFGTVLAALVSLNLAFAQDKADRLDALLQKYASSGQFNGVALVAEDGKILLEKGYGYANLEWKIPNDPSTKFLVGSINKQFFAMVIMKLVEEGKLRLDGKVSEYLPAFRKDVGNKVTIHHLLTHSSGIPWTIDYNRFATAPADVDEVVKTVCSGDPEFEPGTRYKYSTSGFYLLGAIAQKVSGIPYTDFLERTVLGPAGMKDVGFDKEGVIVEHRASGYRQGATGLSNVSFSNPKNWAVAMGIMVTARDLFRWDQALYGENIIPKRYLDQVFGNQIATGENFRGSEAHYGYGWDVLEYQEGGTTKKIIRHNGGDIGFQAIIIRFVSDRKTIILLANVAVIPAKLPQITSDLEDTLYGRTPAAK